MSNDIVIEAWNTVLFEKFSRFKYLFVEGYAAISDEILGRYRIAEGARVLDVGCESGIARSRLPDSSAKTGWPPVLIAPAISSRNASAPRRAGIDNIRFLVADVEVDDLGGPYDEASPASAPCFSICPVQQ